MLKIAVGHGACFAWTIEITICIIIPSWCVDISPTPLREKLGFTTLCVTLFIINLRSDFLGALLSLKSVRALRPLDIKSFNRLNCLAGQIVYTERAVVARRTLPLHTFVYPFEAVRACIWTKCACEIFPSHDPANCQRAAKRLCEAIYRWPKKVMRWATLWPA
jgi:hypothetical protein